VPTAIATNNDPDLIPPTEEVRRHLARHATEAVRLRKLLRLAVCRDRDEERLSRPILPATPEEVARAD
jgi:hypothetical protein